MFAEENPPYCCCRWSPSAIPVRRAHRAPGRLRRSRHRLLQRTAGLDRRSVRVQWDGVLVRILDPKTGQFMPSHRLGGTGPNENALFHAVGRQEPLSMVPLYQVIRERYAVCWKTKRKTA